MHTVLITENAQIILPYSIMRTPLPYQRIWLGLSKNSVRATLGWNLMTSVRDFYITQISLHTLLINYCVKVSYMVRVMHRAKSQLCICRFKHTHFLYSN